MLRSCIMIKNRVFSRAATIHQNVSLADKNWFKTGGRARYYAEPKTTAQCRQVIACAKKTKLDLLILGAGANVLLSDDGFSGAALSPALTDMVFDPAHQQITAGAGVHLDNLIAYMLDNNAVGLEVFSGIPGTVGGSVYINVHYFEHLLSQFLVKATLLELTTNTVIDVDNNWFNFGYDQSTLNKKEHLLLNAIFQVTSVGHGKVMFARGRREEIIRHRKRRYPTETNVRIIFQKLSSP